MNHPPPTSPLGQPGPAPPQSGWRATTATTAAAAVVLLLAAVGTHSVGLGMAALLAAGGALTGFVEARRRAAHASPSPAAAGLLAVLTTAAALTCLLALLTRPIR
jgi:hypothetical protein